MRAWRQQAPRETRRHPLSNELAFSRDEFLAAVRAVAPKTRIDDTLTTFLDQYGSDAFVEDFLALTTEDAAALAISLWDFNRDNEKKPARVIRVRRAVGANGKPLKMDIAEIVGADIAFLVDSSINVCHDAKVEIRAVLHPVVEGPAGKRSTIQIHLPLLDESLRADLQKRRSEEHTSELQSR